MSQSHVFQTAAYDLIVFRKWGSILFPNITFLHLMPNKTGSSIIYFTMSLSGFCYKCVAKHERKSSERCSVFVFVVFRSSDLLPPASVCCTGGRDQLGWAGPVSTMFYNVCCESDSDIGVTWINVREL